MKKVLMATTAVAGMAAFATAASAQEGPQLSIGGAVTYLYHFYDNENTGNGHDLVSDTQNVIFTASATADNGLNYTAYLDMDYQNAAGNVTADEAHVQFSGNWGLLRIGDNDGAEEKFQGGESVLSGTGGYDGDAADFWVTNNVAASFGSASFGPTIAGDSGDATKIYYATPNFSGFSAAISFAPDTAGFNTNSITHTNIENLIEVGASYQGNFDAFSFGINGAYHHATERRARDDVSAFAIGANVGFGGFKVAAGYGDNGDSSCVNGVAGCDAGDFWNVGVSYGAGPWKVSAGYHEAEGDLGGTGSDATAEIFSIGGAYTIAQGLSAFAEYNNGEFTAAGAGGATTDNQSFIIGTGISF